MISIFFKLYESDCHTKGEEILNWNPLELNNDYTTSFYQSRTVLFKLPFEDINLNNQYLRKLALFKFDDVFDNST
jgi:hypothetical protein